MKLSQYTLEVKVNQNTMMLYNTLSRQYYSYAESQREELWDFLNHINKGNYSVAEIELVRELLNKRIVKADEADELVELEYLENNARFQTHTFHIMIYATNACNFRCTYCTQEHVVRDLSNDVVENILKFAEVITKKVRTLHVGWFGGEPLLQYEKMIKLLDELDEMCNNNHCVLKAYVITNGYLLNKKMIREMKANHIESMQITVDGSPAVHDKNRHLANGEKTYAKIMSNILEVLEQGIAVILRINVGDEDVKKPLKVLDEIPYRYRKLVTVNVCNVFQNREKVSTYEWMRQAIDMGYVYGGRRNAYAPCIASMSQSLVIDTDGKLLLCTNTDKEEKAVGKLESGGNVVYKDIDLNYKMKTISARYNKVCKECVELPFCIGSCKYGRLQDNSKCLGKKNDGMTLEERACLDYYYDMKRRIEDEGETDE